jgi:hypothetical protein
MYGREEHKKLIMDLMFVIHVPWFRLKYTVSEQSQNVLLESCV